MGENPYMSIPGFSSLYKLLVISGESQVSVFHESLFRLLSEQVETGVRGQHHLTRTLESGLGGDLQGSW